MTHGPFMVGAPSRNIQKCFQNALNYMVLNYPGAPEHVSYTVFSYPGTPEHVNYTVLSDPGAPDHIVTRF